MLFINQDGCGDRILWDHEGSIALAGRKYMLPADYPSSGDNVLEES